MSNQNGNTAKVVAALEELGSATLAELVEYLDLTLFQVNGTLTNLRKKWKTIPKRVYIRSWKRGIAKNGITQYQRVYALGNMRDATRPKPLPSAEIRKRYMEKLAASQSASIFHVGMSGRQHILLRRAIIKGRVSPSVQANE